MSEYTDEDGEMSWHVVVWDNDRPPFIDKYFSTRAAAESFFTKVRRGK